MSLKNELVKAIQDESNHFDMETFVVEGTEKELPSCKTAACMAGWICALRPDRVSQLKKNHYSEEWGFEFLDIAHKIWDEEGDGSHLDFYGDYHETGDLSEITREEAIYHIQNNGNWPDKDAQNARKSGGIKPDGTK